MMQTTIHPMAFSEAEINERITSMRNRGWDWQFISCFLCVEEYISYSFINLPGRSTFFRLDTGMASTSAWIEVFADGDYRGKKIELNPLKFKIMDTCKIYVIKGTRELVGVISFEDGALMMLFVLTVTRGNRYNNTTYSTEFIEPDCVAFRNTNGHFYCESMNTRQKLYRLKNRY